MYYKEMYYETVGKGNKTILFLHGWGGSSKSFYNIKDYFEDTRLIFIDLPGFGKSITNKQYNLGDYSSLLNDFIKSLNLDNILIVSHSFGGRITLKMLEQTPYKCILVSTPGFERKTIKIKFKILLNKLFHIKFPSKDYKSSTPIQRKIMNNIIKDTKNLDYKKIKGEVLIIHSKKDKTVPYKIAKKMNKAIKNSGLVSLGKSHFPFIDNPFGFYKVVDSYVSN